MRKPKINYNDTFGTMHSRDYYRGASFHFSGKWISGAHYVSDDYNVDFVVHGQTLLACAKSHLSTLDNEPTEFITDESGTAIGVISTYWDFVLSGIVGDSPGIKIIDNYWYICKNTGVPEEEQVWENTGVKAKMELSDLSPEEIALLQEPGKQVVTEFVNNTITQETGQNTNKIMSQKAVTDVLNTKATVSQVTSAITNEIQRADLTYQPKGDYATNTTVSANKTDADNKIAVVNERINTTNENVSNNADAIQEEIENRESEIERIEGLISAEETARVESDNALSNRISQEATARSTADNNLEQSIANINSKIPSEASSSNQLADKDFVHNEISTSSATFRGTYNTLVELEAQEADNNDYGFVVHTDALGNTIYSRYKYNGTEWLWEYDITSTEFSQSQWEAVNSGINSTLVTKLTDLPTNADLTAALNNKVDKVTGKALSKINDIVVTDANSEKTMTISKNDGSSDLVVDLGAKFSSAEKTKLSGIESNAQVNILEGVQVNGTDLQITNKKVNVDISGKVDKVSGKGLSTNDYTNTEKTKLEALPTKAELDTALDAKVDKAGNESETSEFVFRQTGAGLDIDAKNARISSIKGKTLAWNQQYNNIAFTTSEESGITYTVIDRFTWNINGTASDVNSKSFVAEDGLIVGHKYYISIGKSVSGLKFRYGSQESEFGANSLIILASNNECNVQYVHSANASISNVTVSPILIDLTRMFGAGNEPSTVEEFEALFPLPYYAYNEGTLISNNADSIETVGFNQWDEEWDNGYYDASGNPVASTVQIRSKELIPVFPSTTYYISRQGVLNPAYRFCFYDANGDFISRSELRNTPEFTTGDNVYYIKFHIDYSPASYNHDICINLSDPAKNGTYEPYRKSTMQLNLGSFQVRDSQGNVTTITGGLKSAGSVYDEIVGNKYIQRVGSVDLGTLNWIYDGSSYSYGIFASTDIINKAFGRKLICSIYSIKITPGVTDIINMEILGSSSNENIYIRNDNYVSSDSFKAAMSGVMLNYELATPEEYDLAEPLRTDYTVDKLGTERVIAESPICPFRADIHYYESSVKDIEIENMPQYLKREELTDELDKLQDIESGAQVNKIEHIQIDGVEQTITDKTVNLPAYPTTLPASDVYTWAKQSTKPSYNLSEIGNADDVKAIENLTETSGYLKKTGSNTWTLNTTVVTVRELGTVDDELNNLAYGIQWTKNASTCTRVGNPLLHRTLPIQFQMKGCVEKNGEVVYWLNSSDWAYKENGDASALDGTDGYVRVYVPKFYGKSWDTTESGKVMISPVKIDDTWVEIPEHFEDAYESALDRTNLKLCSVMNTTTQYRGGTNSTAYDSSEAMKSLLGKPVTNISRATARTYASNAGSELLNYNIYKWIFLWLPVIEYCNFDLQTAINANLTADGYHQGGLGSGATTFSLWGNYNGYNPIIPCGLTNSLGNGSGQVGINYAAFDSYAAGTVYANRYRGLECPFGDVWTNLDGVIVDSNHSDYDLVYTCDDASKYGDSITSYYTNTSKSIHTDGYVKEFDLGSTGEITAISVGGGKADYHYTGSVNSTLRTLLAGGYASYGGPAGPGSLYSSFGVSYSGASIGFRSIKRIY